jgi:hypothetical protein
MLMVLHASQISAVGVTTCSLAKSTRLPKATADDSALVSEPKKAAL